MQNIAEKIKNGLMLIRVVSGKEYLIIIGKNMFCYEKKNGFYYACSFETRIKGYSLDILSL